MYGDNYVYRYRLIRVAFVAIGLMSVLVFFAWNSDESPVTRERIIGQVLTVEQGEAMSRRTQSPVTLVTAVVELPDGERTRIMVFGAAPQPGSSIHLFEDRHADGSRSYRHDPMGQSGI